LLEVAEARRMSGMARADTLIDDVVDDVDEVILVM
jgi:hypothetical protein